MDRMIVDVVKALDITDWVENLIGDIITDIDDRLDEMFNEEGRIKYESAKKIERIFVEEIIKALTENYLKDNE